MTMEPQWLTWAKELQSIAQAGLAYSKDPYDCERFQHIRELSAQIVARHTGVDKTIVEDLFCNETGYQTPKIDVRGAVFRGDTILLVRETIDGRWSLPGGWGEPNLSLRENVEREVREEAGLLVEAQKLIALLDRKRHNEPDKPFPYGVYKAFVLCREAGGAFAPNIETQDSGFFPLMGCRNCPSAAPPKSKLPYVFAQRTRKTGKRCSTELGHCTSSCNFELRGYLRAFSICAKRQAIIPWNGDCMVTALVV